MKIRLELQNSFDSTIYSDANSTRMELDARRIYMRTSAPCGNAAVHAATNKQRVRLYITSNYPRQWNPHRPQLKIPPHDTILPRDRRSAARTAPEETDMHADE